MGCTNTKAAGAEDKYVNGATGVGGDPAVHATPAAAELGRSKEECELIESLAASCIEASQRGRSIRKQLSESSTAAAQIQAAHRGKSCRQKLNAVSHENCISVAEARKLDRGSSDLSPSKNSPRSSATIDHNSSSSSPASSRGTSPSVPASPMMLPTGMGHDQGTLPSSPKSDADGGDEQPANENAPMPESFLEGDSGRRSTPSLALGGAAESVARPQVRIIAHFDPTVGDGDGKDQKDALAKEQAKVEGGEAERAKRAERRSTTKRPASDDAEVTAAKFTKDIIEAALADVEDEEAADNEWLEAHFKLQRGASSLKRAPSGKVGGGGGGGGKGSGKRKGKGGGKGGLKRSSSMGQGVGPAIASAR